MWLSYYRLLRIAKGKFFPEKCKYEIAHQILSQYFQKYFNCHFGRKKYVADKIFTDWNGLKNRLKSLYRTSRAQSFVSNNLLGEKLDTCFAIRLSRPDNCRTLFNGLWLRIARACIIRVCHAELHRAVREITRGIQPRNALSRDITVLDYSFTFTARLSFFTSARPPGCINMPQSRSSSARTHRCQLFQFPSSTGEITFLALKEKIVRIRFLDIPVLNPWYREKSTKHFNY